MKDACCARDMEREPAQGGSLEMGYQPPFLDQDGRYLFGASECLERSQLYERPSGQNQSFEEKTREMSQAMSLAKQAKLEEPGRVPLAIVLAPRHSEKQVTFIRVSLQQEELRTEVLQQILVGNNVARILGVFGFEDEEPSTADCMVCYERLRSVIILPCRHCSVCSTCLRSLRDERCPMCRSSFSAYLLLPLLHETA
ncbi:unnamed protein product [Durusdinium trenchii]|uniref:RING-type domain-containing protein n=1 Tax=Durusdinium trenchii TaxID=1381693 RepID=A0ABP0LTH5_9DINO